MFNQKNKINNKTIHDKENKLSVRCKIIVKSGITTNYLINIKDYKNMTTILLDKDGNPMFSQVIL